MVVFSDKHPIQDDLWKEQQIENRAWFFNLLCYDDGIKNGLGNTRGNGRDDERFSEMMSDFLFFKIAITEAVVIINWEWLDADGSSRKRLETRIEKKHDSKSKKKYSIWIPEEFDPPIHV